MVAVDLAGGGDGGWMWYRWLDVVVDSAGLRKREIEERERQRERKNKK